MQASHAGSVQASRHAQGRAARASSPREAAPAGDEAAWTVLVYQDGLSNLAPYIQQNFKDIAAVGGDERVDIVAQKAMPPRHKEAGVRRYDLSAPGKPRLLERIDSEARSPETLQQFLEWGMKSYPARHTMVVMSGHGEGFLGVCTDQREKGMAPEELRTALERAQEKTGRTIDVLTFDACHMGQAEVLHALGTTVPYVVGSEEIIGLVGLPYTDIMGGLKEHPGSTPRQLVTRMVEQSAQDEVARQEDEIDEGAFTLAAFDTRKFDGLRQSMEDLACAILETRPPVAALRGVIQRTQRYMWGSTCHPYSDFKDVGDFAERILQQKSGFSPSVRSAAEAVGRALEAVVVAEQHEGEGMSRSHGLSVYLPTGFGKERAPKGGKEGTFDPTHGYKETAFAKDTHWDEMLAWLSGAS